MQSQRTLRVVIIVIIIVFVGDGLITYFLKKKTHATTVKSMPVAKAIANWRAPDTSLLPLDEKGMLIRYGRELVVHTSAYLGPHGTIAAITNGMNCQNCHLDAGTRIWGNNYSAVFSTYPRFRERSGTIENIYKRINDCIERSLNGNRIDTSSKEMQAIASYISWVGGEVEKNVKPQGAGIRNLAYLDRAADTVAGRKIYIATCQRCHGKDGQGQWDEAINGYTYPPLWGEHSYNTGAGIFRLSRLAGYVKDNMPWGATYQTPELSDGEAWDVSAFVNSQQRPSKKFQSDWPDIATKPIDHPFGPYKDRFPEAQHKYGPYKEMLDRL